MIMLKRPEIGVYKNIPSQGVLGIMVKGNSLSGQNIEHCIWLFILSGMRDDQSYGSTLIYRQGVMVFLNDQSLSYNWTGKLVH